MCYVRYYVHKKTLTQADVFAAVGLAKLLDSGQVPARIRSEGNYFVIEAREINGSPLCAQQLYSYIYTGRNNEQRPANLHYYDLEHHRNQENERTTRRRQSAQQLTQNQELARELAPDPEFSLYNIFVTMQAHNGANNALISIAENQSDWHDVLTGFIEALREPNDQNLPQGNLGATANQLINPLSAKGTYGLTPAGTNRCNPSLQELGDNEILQYLRYGGYFNVAVPYSSGGNIRLLTPIPNDISLRALRGLAGTLRRIQFPSRARLKIDALAVLELTDLLIRHSEPYAVAGSQDEEFQGLTLQCRTPASVISGVHVAYYMRTSAFGRNVAEISILGLPDWIRIDSRDDAEFWLSALKEHKNVVRGLDESHSEAIDLLQKYRRIFQSRGGDILLDFLNFAGFYGAYWMSATNNMSHRPLLQRFSTSVMERMVERMVESMAPGIAPILNDPGFQAIAKAIRKATVSAQAIRARGEDPQREIRYGLINDILRKRFVRDELIEELSIFIARYNAENARIREINQSVCAAPPNVTTSDMESIIRIIDQTNNPALVGALLAAYGTCRESSNSEETSCQGEHENLHSTEDSSEE